MMTDILRQILQMSLYGSIAIIGVLIFRAVFRKLPRRVTCSFWAIAAIRLLCPFNPGMKWSLASLFSDNSSTSEIPAVMQGEKASYLSYRDTAITARNIMEPVGSGISAQHASSYMPEAADKAVQAAGAAQKIDIILIATIVWLVVGIGLIIFVLYKSVAIRSKLSGGIRHKDGSFTSGNVTVPFVSGLVRPRIFVPEVMSEKERSFILLHEQTHIRYLDHVTKMVGVITVCIHWFNPLVWLAFFLFSRDIEMRVDETVIETLGEDIKKDYCLSMVSFAKTPLIYKVLNTAFSGRSFGGSEVKMRIKNLINYKKISAGLGAIVTITAIGVTAVLSSCAAPDTAPDATSDTEGAADTEVTTSESEAETTLESIMSEVLDENAAEEANIVVSENEEVHTVELQDGVHEIHVYTRTYEVDADTDGENGDLEIEVVEGDDGVLIVNGGFEAPDDAPDNVTDALAAGADVVIEIPEDAYTNGDVGSRAADNAIQMIGTPFVWGASSQEAVDISGLITYCYAQEGIDLPHSCEELREVGTEVPVDEILPGDIVCWTSDLSGDDYCSHVAIYVGDGMVVDAHGDESGVCYNSVDLHPILTVRRVA